MNMNLKKLSKDISSTYFKKGEALVNKNVIRELEEVEKNRFIAFVDDGPHSFDVMISIDEKKFDILEHTCDCEEKYVFCEHKVAVALYLKDRGKSDENSLAKKIRTKKIDPLRNFVDDLDATKLKDWVYALVKANKEISHNLKNHFDKKSIVLTDISIETETMELAKLIMGKSKYYDAAKLVKVINVWQPYHLDVINEIMMDPLNEDKWSKSKTLLKVIYAFRARSKTSSNKLEKYIELLFEKISLKLSDLTSKDRDAFIIKLVDAYLTNIHANEPYLIPISNHILLLKEDQKVKSLTEIIKKLVQNEEEGQLTILYNRFEDASVLKDYICLFKPLYGKNEYNLHLIQNLIEFGYLNEAERFCLTCIKRNTNINYNIDYHQVLKSIYKANHDDIAYFEQVKIIVPITLDFEDYTAYIAFEKNKVERENFENKISKKLRSSIGSIEYGKFNMQLLASKKEYSMLINLISASYPVELYYPYAEVMFNHNKNEFLKRLLFMKYDNYMYRNFDEKDAILWTDILNKYYTKEEVSKMYTEEKVYTIIDTKIKAYLAN
jgi:hypothetical protein